MSVAQNTKKLAQLLLKAKVIDRAGFDTIFEKHNEKEVEDTKAAKKHSVKKKREVDESIRFIVDLQIPLVANPKKIVTDEEIGKVLAALFKLEFLKLDPLDLDLEIVTRTIPKPFALKHMILPLYDKDGKLQMAVADPECHDTLEAISKVSRKEITPIVSSASDIVKIIHEFFGFKDSVSGAERQSNPNRFELGNLEQLNRIKQPDQIKTDDEHVLNAVDFMFNSAFDLRASDIHLEPKRDKCIIRFRIDGQLNDVYKIPKGVAIPIASRIKMLARMNIAEKRRPQDGRIKIESENKSAEIRVSSMPTAFGEKLALRVLQPDMLVREMDTLGFFTEELIKMENFINRPHGIVLVTGPTGSGKTTTLYSALGMVASPELNIVTIEDPIETIVETFNQVAVQPSVGLTFANSLRTILRQDPDVIMIGEIRDPETADNAMQAALTGHLVLSTLHTNNTAASITRLMDLGIKPYLINAGLIGVLAQRLVRMVCPHCAQDVVHTKAKLARFGVDIDEPKAILKEGKGCEECRFSGYLGRTSVFEVLEIDEDIRNMIQDGKTSDAIRQHAFSRGMTGLRENAVRKVLEGTTTLSEMLRLGYRL